MPVKALISLRQALLLIVVTIALTATGFAHRMPSQGDEAVAYALANGLTVGDLCAGDLDGDGLHDPHCPACQIAGSADLPPMSMTVIALALAFHAQVIAPRETRGGRRILDPGHSPQAPPVA
jgi:hypothetical protein